MAIAAKMPRGRALRTIKEEQPPPQKTIVHVAVKTEPTWKDGAMIHEGLIFDPTVIYSDLHPRAREYYREFFCIGDVCAVMPIEIDASLGSWVEQLVDTIGARSNGIWITGMIAHFNVGRGQQAERFWQSLHALAAQMPACKKAASA